MQREWHDRYNDSKNELILNSFDQKDGLPSVFQLLTVNTA